MKKQSVILAFFLMSTSIMALDLNPKLLVVTGHRFGNDELNGNGAFYVSGKMNIIEREVKGFKQLNLISLGVNYQDDKKWALSVSPVSVTSLSGLTLGLDYIPKTKNVNGDVFGLFVGYKFP